MNTIINQAKVEGWKVSTSGRSLDVLSRQWMSRRADEKFLTMADLQAHTKARADRMREVRLDTKDIEILSPDITEQDDRKTVLAKFNQITLAAPGLDPVGPSHWAFGQIAGLAKAPAAWLRTMPGANVANDLTYALKYNRGNEAVKLYADDLEAAAITGPDYGRIFDWEVTEAVRAATESGSGDHRWKVPGMLDWRTMVYDPLHPVTLDTTTLFASDRGVFVFLCQDLAPIEIGKLPNGEPDYVFRGFYVTNSEVGAGSLKLGAMYLRAICCNRILWGVEAFEELTMRHAKYAPNRFIEEARPALESFANGSSQKLIDGVRAAKVAIIADTKENAVDWVVARGLSAKRAAAIYDRFAREEWGVGADEEVPKSRPVDAWTMAQGITSVARDETNFDTRMDLEKVAGTILNRVTA